jgi:hypothetical protein
LAEKPWDRYGGDAVYGSVLAPGNEILMDSGHAGGNCSQPGRQLAQGVALHSAARAESVSDLSAADRRM